MSVPELQRPPSLRSGRTIACTSCYKCLHTLLHYHITCRVLPGCGNTQAQLLSEVGYVGGRSRSCNGLCPHDLVELSPVAAVTNVISPRCTTTALAGPELDAVASCPSLPQKTVTLVVVPELQRPPSLRSGRTIACSSCYECHRTLFHHYSTRRVLAGCGSILPKSPSEDGYVGGRSRSCNGLRPYDLVEL